MEIPRLKNILHFLIALAAIILFIGSWRGDKTFADYFELQASQVVLKNAVKRLEGDIEYLEGEITKINESKSYAERVYRDKYHYTEKNETIMFIGD